MNFLPYVVVRIIAHSRNFYIGSKINAIKYVFFFLHQLLSEIWPHYYKLIIRLRRLMVSISLQIARIDNS